MDDTSARALRIRHRTRYLYAERVSQSRHRSFLTPRTTLRQRLASSAVAIEPPPDGSTSFLDYFGNPVTLFAVDSPHRTLVIEARSAVTLGAEPPGGAPASDGADAVRSTLGRAESPDDLQALEFCFRSPHIPLEDRLGAYAREAFIGESFRAGVARLMRRIHDEFEYDPAVTTVSTPVSTVFEHKRGVCQDFAHVMIACLRSAGLAARYVSGYLVPAPGVVGAQASHAWVSVYEPGAGWIDFDPTNDVTPSTGHVTLAWGRDYSDVTPFSGVVTGGGEHDVSVDVEIDVERG